MANGFLRPLPALPSSGTPTPSHPCETRKVVVFSGILPIALETELKADCAWESDGHGKSRVEKWKSGKAESVPEGKVYPFAGRPKFREQAKKEARGSCMLFRLPRFFQEA